MVRPPLIVAHRGASALERENTLPAFEEAIALGADMIELDVRPTADGQLAVLHDADIGGRAVRSLTASDLRGLFPGLTLFEEVLRRVGGRIALDVEVKEPGIEAAVLDLCRTFLAPDRFLLSSFQPDILRTFRRLDRRVVLGLILDRDAEAGIKLCADHHWPWIMLRDDTAADAAMGRCAQAGLALLVWTVNDPARMGALMGMPQVSGIVTDRPDLALQVRKSLSLEAQNGYNG